MIKTTLTWQKILRFPRKELIKLFVLIASESLCQVFVPISFANIVSSASEISIKKALLWTVINFLIQLLKTLIGILKSNHLKVCKAKVFSIIPTGLSDNEKVILSSFPSKLGQCFSLILKVFFILLFALIYSSQLFLYVSIVILICIVLSLILNKTKIQFLEIVLDVVWTFATALITIYIIILFGKQKIFLTAFLFFSTFINTYLIKPDFDFSYKAELKEINTLLIKLKNQPPITKS